MRKERIKSIILALLILNCLQLTGQIWFNQKLWSSGYNFFNSVSNIPVVKALVSHIPFLNNPSKADDTYANAIRPQKIVISSGKSREVYHPTQKSYDEAYEIVDSVITSLLQTQSPRSAVIKEDEWQSFLKGKSIYIDYGFNMDMNSLANSFSHPVGTSPLSGGNVSDIMITGDSITKEGIVCMLDKTNNTITKYWVDYKGDELLDYIKSITFGRNQNQDFAFEHGLDISPENALIKRDILLSSLVLLPRDTDNMYKISVSNPLDNEGIAFDRIVSAFEYTPSSLRKSVTHDGVASYVENNATIRIDPNGLIEYNAVEAEKGILLQSVTAEPFTLVSKITQIANEVWNASGNDGMLDVRLVSDLVEPRDGEFIVKMNYFFMGTPVITQFDGNSPINNAIYAHVQNGYLKNFKMLMRSFEKVDEIVPTIPVIRALDSLTELFRSRNSTVLIDDIFKCYSSENNIDTVVWGAKIRGEENVVIISSD